MSSKELRSKLLIPGYICTTGFVVITLIVQFKKNRAKEEPVNKIEHSLRTTGLQIKRMKGGGNCYFRGISHQLFNSEEKHYPGEI